MHHGNRFPAREWEARFEPRSYGFRPGRGCHDAIQAAYEVVKGRRPKRLWALDADLAGASARIGHDYIQTMLDTFPARGMIRQWLKAGMVEQGRLHRTEDGVPQGGVISPVLLNVALHGIEQTAGARYDPNGWVRADSPVLIRYADDFIVLCHTRQEALEVKARLAAWLAPRGLAFNEDKTRVVTLDEGFDFLGFNVRRYGNKPLIKPSKAPQRRIRERLRTELRSLRGTNAPAVIKKLNPIIRGWAAYYRTQVSAEVFGGLDHYLCRFSHQNNNCTLLRAPPRPRERLRQLDCAYPFRPPKSSSTHTSSPTIQASCPGGIWKVSPGPNSRSVPSSIFNAIRPWSTYPMWSTWHESVPASGFTFWDQRQPGSNVPRPTA